jgi:hypothetical protein
MTDPATAATASTIQVPPSSSAIPAPVTPQLAVIAQRGRGWPVEAILSTDEAASSRSISPARSARTSRSTAVRSA